MTTVRENLIAARALIDTPDKWKMRGESLVTALRDLDATDYRAAREALALAAGLSHHGQLTMRFFDLSHADIMALFNRAIAALPLNAEGGDK